MNRDKDREVLSQITTVLFFIAGAREQNLMFNSYTADAAFNAACALFEVDPAQFLLKTQGFTR